MTLLAPTAPRTPIPVPPRTAARRGSAYLSTHPRTRLALLLSAPLFWLGAVYVVALALLLVTAFWTTDTYTGEIRTEFTLDNVITVLTDGFYQGITLRTVGVALAVTAIDVLLAVPIAYFMAMVASPALQRALVVLVLTPLWASYLVKAFAWRSVLSNDGILEWLCRRSSRARSSASRSPWATTSPSASSAAAARCSARSSTRTSGRRSTFPWRPPSR